MRLEWIEIPKPGDPDDLMFRLLRQGRGMFALSVREGPMSSSALGIMRNFSFSLYKAARDFENSELLDRACFSLDIGAATSWSLRPPDKVIEAAKTWARPFVLSGMEQLVDTAPEVG